VSTADLSTDDLRTADLSTTPRAAPTAAERADVLRKLARPTSDADRRRARLASIGVAGCGMFLLAAVAIATIIGDRWGMQPDHGSRWTHMRYVTSLAPFLSERGLRGGTTFGAVLLVIPFGLFGLQALRTGTAARERRLAALSLAGATRPQLRRLAFLEGTRAAAIGALLSGPGYLVLWVIFGRLLPFGWRMLPTPGLWVALAWPLLVIGLTLAGGVAARMAVTPATGSPLGRTRRAPRPLTQRDALLPGVPAALLVLGLAYFLLIARDDVVLVLLLPLFVLMAMTGGPWLILATGRWAVRGNLVSSMAGRRLLADVRSPGRVVSVLLVVGAAFGVISSMIAGMVIDALNPDNSGFGDWGFYLAGVLAVALAAALASIVAISSLVVGATEQVLDGRRGIAVLVALAASPRFVNTVVRRQLLLAALPAVALGTVPGWVVGLETESGDAWINLVALLVALLISGLVVAIGVWVAARAVRPAVLASSTPDNLRAP
jgi:hypothetical protein